MFTVRDKKPPRYYSWLGLAIAAVIGFVGGGAAGVFWMVTSIDANGPSIFALMGLFVLPVVGTVACPVLVAGLATIIGALTEARRRSHE